MTQAIHVRRTTCRACGGSQLEKFVSLGPTPLANAFLKSESEFKLENSYPLDVYYCETCSLVQLVDVIDPEVLFRDYIYVTGTSDTIADHNHRYSKSIVELLDLGPDDLVVEVASNNGSLLKCFLDLGVQVLGVEPASNIAKMAQDGGIPTVNSFFTAGLADPVLAEHGPAKVVIGNNVLAHVDDTIDFLTGCKKLLSPQGMVVIEVPYLRELVVRLEYDTIYHEHLCYFSVCAFKYLCDVVGLSLIRVDRVAVHGGSIRVYAGMPEYYGGHSPEVLSLVEEEHRLGLTSLKTYHEFAKKVEKSRSILVDLLHTEKTTGKVIAAYGAPAKGNTLLNYCGIGTQLVDFTVDKNPLKVGMYTPGMHIPVLPVHELVKRQPDYVLILAWNFAEEIMLQQAQYSSQGGRYIIPIPEAKVI